MMCPKSLWESSNLDIKMVFIKNTLIFELKYDTIILPIDKK